MNASCSSRRRISVISTSVHNIAPPLASSMAAGPHLPAKVRSWPSGPRIVTCRSAATPDLPAPRTCEGRSTNTSRQYAFAAVRSPWESTMHAGTGMAATRASARASSTALSGPSSRTSITSLEGDRTPPSLVQLIPTSSVPPCAPLNALDALERDPAMGPRSSIRWWRRGESNSGPRYPPGKHLQAQPPISIRFG